MVSEATVPELSLRRRRLTADDWVGAGLVALGAYGPDAVAVEPLAKVLGTTKGSGYWHWASRDALLDAVLARWETVATDEVIGHIEGAGGTPRRRLARLLTLVVADASARPGGIVTLTHPGPAARAAVARVTRKRIGYVEALLVADGMRRSEATRRATLAYAAYLGYAQLVATVPAAVPAAARQRAAIEGSLLDMLLA